MNTVLNLFVAAVLAGTPLLFGTVGEIMNEKVGHLNLGVEGMMSIGACAGFMVGYQTDNVVFALLAAFAAGVAAALIYAVLTITFMADQNVTGLTLTIFGVGLANFIGEYMLNHSATQSLKLPEHISAQIANLHIPVLSDIPVLGKLLFSYNIFVYIGIVTAVICWYYLQKTKTGLNVRAVGEKPGAADAAGIRVIRAKYINVLIGGGICGIGDQQLCQRIGLDLCCTCHLCIVESGESDLWISGFRLLQCSEILCAEEHHQYTECIL